MLRTGGNYVQQALSGPQRDQRSDAARLDAIKAEVKKVVSAIGLELDGLGRRLNEETERTGSHLGNAVNGDEELLIRAESEMMQAGTQLKRMRSQHGAVTWLTEAFEQVVNAAGPE